jgi:hypothetical protein
VPTIVTVIANPATAQSQVTTTTGGGGGSTTTTTDGFRVFDSTTTTTAVQGSSTVPGESTTSTTEGASVLPEVIEQPPPQSNADEVLARTGMDPTGLLIAGTGLAAAGTVLRVWSARERAGAGTPDAEPVIATEG